ncbi:MAG: hypothetical protein U0L02_08395 [Kandleria vitulina]|jgi:hypothetical protein|uniref:hypothetical protein n=1 Tax=Kandleria vitulina TaxID=1630 RepID=UPI002E782B3E|nr:hypothetical protein [Kandleria vitulina]MEE0989364.1 hypothetical protein [Kandleria vitulina]
MKKILRNTLLISLAFILIGCSKTQSKEEILQEKYKVIESFFNAYSKKNYEEMYKYCTKEMKEGFTQTIKAMPWAALKKEDKIKTHTFDKKEYIIVNLNIETTKLSSIYPDKEWSIFMLVEKEENKWLITNYTTG